MALDFPNSPTVGQFYPTTGSPQWQWDGTKWNAVVPSGGAVITVSDTAPATPSTGTLWFDSVGAQMYLWESDGNSTQWVPVVNQNGALSPAVSNNTGRNLLHNGMFNVQQRGGGPWAPSGAVVYTADRWGTYASNDTTSFSTQPLADSDRSAIGDETARWCLQNIFTGSSTAGSSNELFQGIEGVARLAGKTVTVSFWARLTSGGTWLGIDFVQNFGTGGSPSASVVTARQTLTLSASWARYSLTFSLPSATGKTFGTNNDDRTILEIWYSYQGVQVQSGTIQLWGVQLEIGSQATPLAKRDPADELALCQRYYCAGLTAYLVGPVTFAGTVSLSRGLPVMMRTNPSVTITSTSNTNCTSPGVGALDPATVYAVATSPASGTSILNLTFTASADL